MAADNESLEEKSKKVSEKKIDKGEEVQSFQEAQNQLQQLQAAQKENIQLNRAYSSAQAQQNDIMAQAAEIAASGDNTGPVQGRELQLNPQTQAILGKYGYGRPKTETSTISNSGPVQGRGIIINNKTENKTTNNVNVSTPPTVVSKSGGDGGMSKFKTWISSSFARQKAQDAVRQREFDKKEWSLSRSSRRVMDKLEEVGKTIGENLDPRKVATFFMDQLKTLLFLLGFGLLSKNWKEILKKVAGIEAWCRKTLKYFGISLGDGFKMESGRSQFVKDLISFLGGDPEGKDGAFTVLWKLFKDAVKLFGKRLKVMFKERANAIKALGFPNIDFSNVGEAIRTLGQYIGDLFAIIFGGTEGLKQSIGHTVYNEGRASSMDKKGGWSRDVNPFDSSNIDNTSWGDASIVRGDNVMDVGDFNGDRLANNTSAAIKRAKGVASMMNDFGGLSSQNARKVYTAGVMSGFQDLQNAANDNGGVLVDLDFIKQLSDLGITVPWTYKIRYKFVKRKKDESDFYNEGASPMAAGTEAYIGQEIRNKVTDANPLTSALRTIKHVFLPWTNITDNSKARALGAGAVSGFKRLGADDYTLELVPGTDPRRGEWVNVRTKVGETAWGPKYEERPTKWFYYYTLPPEAIENIRSQLEKKLQMEEGTFKFDTSSRESMEALNKYMTELKKKKIEEKRGYLNANGVNDGGVNARINNLESDYDPEIWKEYDEVDAETKKMWDEYNKEFEDSQTGKFVNNVGDLSDKAGMYLENATGGVIQHNFSGKRDFVNTMRNIYRDALINNGYDTKYTDYIVAMSALESGYGTSELNKQANNFGGWTISPAQKRAGLPYIKMPSRSGECLEYRKFDTKEEWADEYVKYLNRMYHPFQTSGFNEFMQKLVGGKIKYNPNADYAQSVANFYKEITVSFPKGASSNDLGNITTTNTSKAAKTNFNVGGKKYHIGLDVKRSSLGFNYDPSSLFDTSYVNYGPLNSTSQNLYNAAESSKNSSEKYKSDEISAGDYLITDAINSGLNNVYCAVIETGTNRGDSVTINHTEGGSSDPSYTKPAGDFTSTDQVLTT